MAEPIVLWEGDDHDYPVRYVLRDQVNDAHIIDCEKMFLDLCGNPSWRTVCTDEERMHVMRHCLHDLWERGILP